MQKPKKAAKPVKKVVKSRMPTNKELGIKPTRKQKVVAERIVADAAQLKMPFVQEAPPAPSLGALKLPKRNISKYEVLEDALERNGREARLLWRNDFAATYEVKVCDKTSYETFIRVFAEAASGCIRGVNFSTPAREVFPSDRVFGATAWADITLLRATSRFVEATKLAVERFLDKK